MVWSGKYTACALRTVRIPLSWFASCCWYVISTLFYQDWNTKNSPSGLSGTFSVFWRKWRGSPISAFQPSFAFWVLETYADVLALPRNGQLVHNKGGLRWNRRQPGQGHRSISDTYWYSELYIKLCVDCSTSSEVQCILSKQPDCGGKPHPTVQRNLINLGALPSVYLEVWGMLEMLPVTSSS